MKIEIDSQQSSLEKSSSIIGFSGTEKISRPFEYTLRVITKRKSNFDDLLDKPLGFNIKKQDAVRYFHGIIQEVTYRETSLVDSEDIQLTLILTPKLLDLDHESKSRVFRNTTVAKVVKEVLDIHGIEYCTELLESEASDPQNGNEHISQYQESDLRFISRIMKRAKIFYFFDYKDHKHIMRLSNKKGLEERMLELTPWGNRSADAFGMHCGNVLDAQQTKSVRAERNRLKGESNSQTLFPGVVFKLDKKKYMLSETKHEADNKYGHSVSFQAIENLSEITLDDPFVVRPIEIEPTKSFPVLGSAITFDGILSNRSDDSANSAIKFDVDAKNEGRNQLLIRTDGNLDLHGGKYVNIVASDTVVIEGFKTLHLQGPTGNYITIDSSGVRIKGNEIKLNCAGGADKTIEIANHKVTKAGN